MRRPPAVARVLERVTKTAREHEMFRPGETVLACVSGGPDSICLLYSLWYLRRLFGIGLEVFHFDHRMRAGSAADAGYVRRLSQRLELPAHVRTAEGRPRKGTSPEAWARAARAKAADEVRRAIGARVVAEGHTLDDQAETVLLNLVRGGGLEAITGIWPRRGGRPAVFVEPLIDVERTEVESFCRALHLRPRRDPTNLDTRYLRNALRRRAIPALERATGREVKRAIARSAGLLREDRDELSRQASRAAGDVVGGSRVGMTLDAGALRALPRPVASRVVRSALFRIADGEEDALWTREAVEAVLDLAAGRPGRRRDLPHGLNARREREYVVLSRTSPESRV